MLLISQNIKNHYNLEFPDDVILRINLAWCNSLEELKEKLSNVKNGKFFFINGKLSSRWTMGI